MSRLSDAWAALCGRLPVREVPGRAMTCEVYRVSWLKSYPGVHGAYSHRMTAYYGTCVEAHATGHKVEAVRALRTDEGYYLPVGELRAITVQPKPKRAKGARA